MMAGSMTPRDVYEMKSMLGTMLNSLGRVEHRIAAPSQEQLCDLELNLRTARRRHLPNRQGGDPAWEILLHLDRAERSGHRKFVFNLEADLQAPCSTLLRHLSRLQKDGVVQRVDDPNDRRRVEIRLTGKGRSLLKQVVDDALIDLAKSQRLTVTPLPAMIG